MPYDSLTMHTPATTTRRLLTSLTVTVLLVTGCSYPLDSRVGSDEVMRYGSRVERILPRNWKVFKDYNPYGFGTFLVRTTDNARFIQLPTGEMRYLELLVYLSVEDRIGLMKITQAEFEQKERTRRRLSLEQQKLYGDIFPQAGPLVSYLEYLPVALDRERQITEYNRLVDQMRLNERNFPRYFTETFGVKFVYPEPYQISGVPEALKREFLDVVENVKKIFPQYELHNR